MKTTDKTPRTKPVRLDATPCDATKPAAPAPFSLFRELPAPMRARLAAIAPEKLRTMNAELFDMATTMLGAAPALRTLRPQIERELPHFDLQAFDALEDVARAGLTVQACWQAAAVERDPLPALAAEGTALRDELCSECQPIARRGEIPRESFEALPMGNGHRGISLFLLTVSQMLLDAWGKLEGRTAITLAQVERARELGGTIAAAIARREERSEEYEQQLDERQRVFTLMVNTYEQARRAAGYLRFEERDADAFAPSFFAKRGGVRYKDEGAAEGDGERDGRDEAKGGEGKSPVKGPRPEDVVPLGPNGLPLVPQDDPFAKD